MNGMNGIRNIIQISIITLSFIIILYILFYAPFESDKCPKDCGFISSDDRIKNAELYKCHEKICKTYNMKPYVKEYFLDENETMDACQCFPYFLFKDEREYVFNKSRMVRCWDGKRSAPINVKTVYFEDVFDGCGTKESIQSGRKG